jgi:hypothetical protein
MNASKRFKGQLFQ